VVRVAVERYTKQEWLTTLLNTHKDIVLNRIRDRVFANVAITVAVLFARARCNFSLVLAPTMHTLLGGFLGLLLVFRTNAAYARFWEARCIWGKVNDCCRNIAVSISAYV
jgi:ion channel-forming bestrophin family protein